MVKSLGCDCLGLLRGVYKEVTGREPENPPPYSPSWDEVGSQELMLAAANKFLVKTDTIIPGNVLIFRMRRNSVAKHCGIVISQNTMVHAHFSHGVIEENLGSYWISRIAGIFSFPEVK